MSTSEECFPIIQIAVLLLCVLTGESSCAYGYGRALSVWGNCCFLCVQAPFCVRELIAGLSTRFTLPWHLSVSGPLKKAQWTTVDLYSFDFCALILFLSKQPAAALGGVLFKCWMKEMVLMFVLTLRQCKNSWGEMLPPRATLVPV